MRGGLSFGRLFSFTGETGAGLVGKSVRGGGAGAKGSSGKKAAGGGGLPAVRLVEDLHGPVPPPLGLQDFLNDLPESPFPGLGPGHEMDGFFHFRPSVRNGG